MEQLIGYDSWYYFTCVQPPRSFFHSPSCGKQQEDAQPLSLTFSLLSMWRYAWWRLCYVIKSKTSVSSSRSEFQLQPCTVTVHCPDPQGLPLKDERWPRTAGIPIKWKNTLVKYLDSAWHEVELNICYSLLLLLLLLVLFLDSTASTTVLGMQ